MGFFGFLKKEKERENVQFDDMPVPPVSDNPNIYPREQTIQNVPPAPKPIDLGQPAVSQTQFQNEPIPRPVPFVEPQRPVEETTIPNNLRDDGRGIFLPSIDQSASRKESSVPPIPGIPKFQFGAERKTIDMPEIPKSTFANKFGTVPNPEIQKKIDDNHLELKESARGPVPLQKNTQSPNEPEQKVSLFGKINFGEEKSRAQDKLMQKIDEHVEEQIKNKVVEAEKKPNEGLFVKKDAPVQSPKVEVKPVIEQKAPVQQHHENIPMFVGIDSCEGIIYDLNSIRDTVGGKKDIRHQISELQKKEDDIFNTWKNSLEGLQASISKIDRKMFKQVM